MTVSVHDDRTHGSFYETFATIVWIDGNWVGLDHGIEADYAASEAPCLTTVHPLIFGHGVRGAAVRDLRLEGNREESGKSMGGCRGGAVYFAHSRDVEITGVVERNYHGEGLSFQLCRDVRVRDCRFDGNSGNGMHPGAGSTNALFSGCSAEGNGLSGFFFCVRANHITVRECAFRNNETGVSIGTRDCHNLIEQCAIEENAEAGLLVRETPKPTEVHSCLIRDCRIGRNAFRGGKGQVEIQGDAHDLIFERNEISGNREKPGVFAAPASSELYFEANRFSECGPQTAADASSLTDRRPRFECGYGEWPESLFRHLHTA